MEPNPLSALQHATLLSMSTIPMQHLHGVQTRTEEHRECTEEKAIIRFVKPLMTRGNLPMASHLFPSNKEWENTGLLAFPTATLHLP